MIYGLDTGAFNKDGPRGQLERASTSRTSSRSWRALDHDRRFALVTRALRPANDLVDAYPLAL